MKVVSHTPVETDALKTLTRAGGWHDAVRGHFGADAKLYSWWSYRSGARARNVGWRIDYFIVSEDLAASVREAYILPEWEGSDHCPVGLELSLA